ncbi:hypothetical protein C8R44DRAFT_774056 [Mycena epipterygia]|nr:hypothetical protein C8R44DRAFT_774056 [Mycena epipterygia]
MPAATSSFSSSVALPSVVLPKGCSSSDSLGPDSVGNGRSGTFSGCTAGVASVLLSCCTSVGSTAAFVNNTCLCPYNTIFSPVTEEKFFDCVGNNSDAQCGTASGTNSATVASLRNAVVVVLGVALLLGAMGV